MDCIRTFGRSNRFRVLHREDFAEVFRQTVHTARASGLAKLGRVAIDGSKIRANTSRHKAMSHRRMKQAEEALEDEIAQILAQMDERNEAEDEEHGDDDGSGGLPAELQDREQRVAKLRAVREQLEAERGSDLKPSSQKSFADPDANMMMTGEGSLQYCYNAQAATSEDGVIVAAEITTSPRDVGQLVPMVQAVKANTGRKLWHGCCRQRLPERIEPEGASTAAATLPCGSGTRGKAADELAERAPHAAHARGAAPTLGPADLRLPQDARGEALRRDQADHAIPAFLASWTRQHPGRMEPGVRGCERPDHLQSGNGMRKDPTGDHEPGWKPGPGRSHTSRADESGAQPNPPTQEPHLNATPGSGS